MEDIEHSESKSQRLETHCFQPDWTEEELKAILESMPKFNTPAIQPTKLLGTNACVGCPNAGKGACNCTLATPVVT